MQTVGLAFFQFKDWPPLPQSSKQVDIAAWWWFDHRNLLVGHGTYGVLVHHGLGFRHVGGRCGSVGFIGKVLLSINMPYGHHNEHDQGPNERNGDPGSLDTIQWLFPPDGF